MKPTPAPVRKATPPASAPAAAATGASDSHDFSGGEMRANIAGLIGFVVPQLRRGSGAIPLKAVISAMRLGDLGVPQDVVDGVDARGDISFSEGRGANQGERLQKTIPLKHGLSATMAMAPTVSGAVALTADAGFRVCEIEGLSMTVSIIPVPLRVKAVSISSDAIRIKTSFLGVPHTIAIDLTKNPVPSEAAGGRLTDYVGTDVVAFAARRAFFVFVALSAILAFARARSNRNP